MHKSLKTDEYRGSKGSNGKKREKAFRNRKKYRFSVKLPGQTIFVAAFRLQLINLRFVSP
jgi:hypothetical protein